MSVSGLNASLEKALDFCVKDDVITIQDFIILNSIPNLPSNMRHDSAYELTILVTCESLKHTKDTKSLFVDYLKELSSQKRIFNLQKKPKVLGEYPSEDRVRFIIWSEAVMLQLYIFESRELMNEIAKTLMDD